MKKTLLIFTLAFLILSCERSKPAEWYESCVVKDVDETFRYGGLVNDASYTIQTSCGYTIVSKRHVSVGDTIQVKVVSYKKEDVEKMLKNKKDSLQN